MLSPPSIDTYDEKIILLQALSDKIWDNCPAKGEDLNFASNISNATSVVLKQIEILHNFK